MSFDTTNITEASSYAEVDDALYHFEAPFYRACAGGAYFKRTPEWDHERERLTGLLHRKYHRTYHRPVVQKQSFVQRMITKLRGAI